MASDPVARSRTLALAALALSFDLGGILRKAMRMFGCPTLLPAGLQPRPRPAVARLASVDSVGKRVWMIGTTLRLDGAPLSQFEVARGLADSGFDVAVFVKADGPLRDRYRASAIPVEVMPELSCSASVPAWYEADIARLASLLRTGKPDLIIASTIDTFEAIDAARMAGIPSLWNIREGEAWPERLSDRHTAIAARALAAFSYPAALIFVSCASMNVWRDFAPPERSHLIYNASTIRPDRYDGAAKQDVRARLGIAEHEQMAISVGTLCTRKSQVDFARAVASAPLTVRPVFVGAAEPGYRKKIETALGSALNRAVFMGPVSDAAEMIAAADVLVCSSHSEAFPRTLLEAAALQTPIIATALDGTLERLVDGETARLYPPGDVRSLSRLLQELAGDRNSWSALATKAHDQITQAWTHQDMISAYADVVGKALSQA